MALADRYWDSDCFLGWLANEQDKVPECRGVIRAAELGELRIVTSSLTLTEVIKLKKRTPLPAERRDDLRDFFKRGYIVVRQLERFTAERARELIWDHGLDAKDAVHVATALDAHLTQLDTFDEHLIKRSGKIGTPPLRISHPDVPEQQELDFNGSSGEGDEEQESGAGRDSAGRL